MSKNSNHTENKNIEKLSDSLKEIVQEDFNMRGSLSLKTISKNLDRLDTISDEKSSESLEEKLHAETMIIINSKTIPEKNSGFFGSGNDEN